MQHVHADRSLAEKIEASVVADLALYARACEALDPGVRVDTARLAGGLALFVAPGSPVNMLFGAGFDGPVTVADLDATEEFFAARGTRAAISLSPLADESMLPALAARGWLATDFENVLVRPFEPGAEPPDPPEPRTGIRVHAAETAQDRAAWAALSARAFTAPDAPEAEVVRLSLAAAAREDLALFSARVGLEDAATGALWLDGDLAWLVGDATLPHARNRGAQTALIAERCRRAALGGSRLAVAETAPGSASQRNMERLGFSVVYTRVELVAPPRLR